MSHSDKASLINVSWFDRQGMRMGITSNQTHLSYFLLTFNPASIKYATPAQGDRLATAVAQEREVRAIERAKEPDWRTLPVLAPEEEGGWLGRFRGRTWR